MPLIKAQCTNCGGVLEVDKSKDAAICPFCGTPYVVEKAVQNYITNNTYVVNNENSSYNPQKNAFTLVRMGDYKNALPLFNKLVQSNPQDWKNWFGKSFCEHENLDYNCLVRAYNLAPSEYKKELKEMCDLKKVVNVRDPKYEYTKEEKEKILKEEKRKDIAKAVMINAIALIMSVVAISSFESSDQNIRELGILLIPGVFLFIKGLIAISDVIRFDRFINHQDLIMKEDEKKKRADLFYKRKKDSWNRINDIANSLLSRI